MRALLWICGCFCVGILSGSVCHWSPGAGTILAAGVFGVASLMMQGRVGAAFLPLLFGSVLVLGAGAVRWAESGAAFRGGLARLTIEVERSACGTYGCSATSRLLGCESVDPDACPAGDGMGVIRSERELPRATRLLVLARTKAMLGFRNPTPAFVWPFQPATFIATAVKGVPAREVQTDALARALATARNDVRNLFDRTLVATHSGIARALILGEGQAVDSELNDAIRASGVSHVLAVSGMHVTVLAGALVWLVRMLWLRSPWACFFEARRVASTLGIVLSPLVALFAGSSPSALRSAIAASVSYGAYAIARRPNALAVSAAALIVCAVMYPHDALHPGLVLSVLATNALLTMQGKGGGFRDLVVESLRTWMATLPFLVVTFGTSQIVGVGANLVLAPFGTLLIPLAVGHLFVAAFLPLAAPVTTWTFETASAAFVTAAQVFANVDPKLALPPLTPLQALAFAVSCWGALFASGLRKKAAWLTAGACVIGICEIALRRDLATQEARFVFLDVGQGDATLIETGDGKHILIDAGGNPQGGEDPGARAVLPYLRARRIASLDAFVLSHPHPDHYGGLRAVMNALPIKEIWDSGQGCIEQEEGTACKLLAQARARGTRILGPRDLCPATQRLGSLEIELIAPCPEFDQTLGPNDNSLVMRVTHGQNRLLFVGDAEHEQEHVLLSTERPRLSAHVLKVGHHGSRTSSTEDFLRAVQPWLSVVSAGRGNPFGHPHAEVVERLGKMAPNLMRTDLVGGVRVRSDGTRLWLEDHKNHVGDRREQ